MYSDWSLQFCENKGTQTIIWTEINPAIKILAQVYTCYKPGTQEAMKLDQIEVIQSSVYAELERIWSITFDMGELPWLKL